MRNIKFKIWDKVNKNMIEWKGLRYLPIWKVFTQNKEEDTMEILEYSGVNDRLGNEIYDGDIIEFEGKIYIMKYLNTFHSWRLMGMKYDGKNTDKKDLDIKEIANKSLLLANQYMHSDFLKSLF